jgi:hypothetical protein
MHTSMNDTSKISYVCMCIRGHAVIYMHELMLEVILIFSATELGNAADDRRTLRVKFSGEWRLHVEKRQDSPGVPSLSTSASDCSKSASTAA